ncbi:MAG: DUF3293 domain-containing protein [Saprospiraceae bacterium]|nr:DUF3293 domain-containing protein [Saprospiraceae bacterium]
MIDKASFLAIYKNTNYIIPELHTKIKIDELNAIIDSELLKSNHSYWAFISAANPFSKEISDQENEFNFLKLKNLIDAQFPKYFEGYGEGLLGWKNEKSILIFGITEEQAIKIGKQFGQNAIVVGVRNEPSKIIWLQD